METGDKIVRPNIELPNWLWKEVQKAAIDRDIPAKQLVAEVMADYLGAKHAA